MFIRMGVEKIDFKCHNYIKFNKVKFAMSVFTNYIII